MRPEAIRKALLDAEGCRTTVHLNDGTRIPVPSREHWLIGPEFLWVVDGRDVHRIAFRNIASIATRSKSSSRSKRGA